MAAALCACAAATLAFAPVAPAAITTGPVDPAHGFPFSYDDDVAGFGLQLCQDNSGNCIETVRPDPNAPISVPDNFTEDGEGFWWLADATVPNAGTGLARFAKEAAFDTDVIEQGHQVSFSRIRFRFQGLVAGDTYRVTHPFGVTDLVADPDPGAPGSGRINFTNDIGCIGPPCGTFPAIAGDPVTAFLQWDATLPAPPPGYIGNPLIGHTVAGSPFGTNFVRLERVIPPVPPAVGPTFELVGETDTFFVQGKLAGAPPAPAPHVGLSSASLAFGSRQVGSPSAAQIVTLTNHGTADLHLGTLAVGGTDAADFAKSSDACSGATLAPTATCTVAVRFAPAHTGSLSAALAVPSDSLNNPHSIALAGVGTAAAPPATGGGAAAGGTNTTTIITRLVPVVGTGSGGVAGVVARPLTVSGLSVARRIAAARLSVRGLRLAMRVPRGTQIVRVRIYRVRNGARVGRALVTAVRLPVRSGRFVIRLRSSKVRNLPRGRYVVLVTPSTDQGDRGATSRIAFTVTR